jgi:isocitrate dehydrogenase
MYWAEALATQPDAPELSARFAPVSAAFRTNAEQILTELNRVQGAAMDVGGYYQPDEALAQAAMRPSATLNAIIAAV